jgi:hypothetical protein
LKRGAMDMRFPELSAERAEVAELPCFATLAAVLGSAQANGCTGLTAVELTCRPTPPKTRADALALLFEGGSTWTLAATFLGNSFHRPVAVSLSEKGL